MDYLKRSKEIYEETVSNRRVLHQNPETGLELPQTKAFVKKKLEEYGLDVKECGEGLSATIGKEGKVILLRADMDALPIKEESGLDFASKNDNAHACGHDLHTAYLLSAAKMLKENEANLEGTVKFMFQPGEEIFMGSKNMVEHGILENPKVDVAMGFHVAPGQFPINLLIYNSKSTMMFSSDNFRITIKGKGTHGAVPQLGVDPISIGTSIFTALQKLISREVDPSHACVLSIGKFIAGTALNVIPSEAIMEGTLRCDNEESRAKLVRRIKEVVEKTADLYNGEAKLEILANVPMLKNDKELCEEFIGYITNLDKDVQLYPDVVASSSEDFAVICNLVPSVFFYISTGFEDERGAYPVHNPKVTFNEESCVYAPAYFAECATQWLKNNK